MILVLSRKRKNIGTIFVKWWKNQLEFRGGCFPSYPHSYVHLRTALVAISADCQMRVMCCDLTVKKTPLFEVIPLCKVKDVAIRRDGIITVQSYGGYIRIRWP